MPLSAAKTDTLQDDTMVNLDSKLDTLLNAFQKLDVRMNDTDSKVQNQFWAMNSRFSTLENSLEKSDCPDSDNEDTKNLPSNDNDSPPEPNQTYDMSSEGQDNVSHHPRRHNNRNRYQPPQSADTQQSFLNQNEFTLAISNNKIKYVNMETYLHSKVLKNDSAEALKQVYSFITRAISNGFSVQLGIMPSFMELDKDTCFET